MLQVEFTKTEEGKLREVITRDNEEILFDDNYVGPVDTYNILSIYPECFFAFHFSSQLNFEVH